MWESDIVQKWILGANTKSFRDFMNYAGLVVYTLVFVILFYFYVFYESYNYLNSQFGGHSLVIPVGPIILPHVNIFSFFCVTQSILFLGLVYWFKSLWKEFAIGDRGVDSYVERVRELRKTVTPSRVTKTDSENKNIPELDHEIEKETNTA